MNTLLLAALSATFVRTFNQQYSALIVTLVAAFALFDVAWRDLDSRWRNTARLGVIWLILGLIVIAPTAVKMAERASAGPAEHVHDSAIQTEAAARFLRAGINPYGADYTTTPLMQWPQWNVENPALHHNTYMPLTFLIALPFDLIAQTLWGWFDIRLILILVLIAIWVGLPHLADDWDRKLGLLIVFGLNPLFVPFFIEGRNDVLVLGGLVAMLLFLRRANFSGAAIALGLTCVVKQTAWFMIPFFLAHCWFIASNQDRRAQFTRIMFALLAPGALVVLPFLFWNAPAFIEDTLIFQFAAFKAEGYGVSQLMLLTGILPDRWSPFPFAALVIGAGALMIAWSVRHQRAHLSLRALMGASAGLTFVVMYFSRVMRDSYLGYILALATLAYFMPGAPRDE